MKSRILGAAALAVMMVGATLSPALAKKKGEPEVVTVQHILIGFEKSVPGKTIERTKKQAKALAEQLLERALAGEDFEALVEEYTDDKPKNYKMTNDRAKLRADAMPRNKMAPAFADVAFGLEVGGIGMAKYSQRLRPSYGWHIIKRIE